MGGGWAETLRDENLGALFTSPFTAGHDVLRLYAAEAAVWFFYTQITPCLCNFTRLVCFVGDSGHLKRDWQRVGVLPQFKKCS